MIYTFSSLNQHLDRLYNPKQQDINRRFFKTTVGAYAEGEQFLGIKVPLLRDLAKQTGHLNFDDLAALLNTPINEKRLLALFILITQYTAAQKNPPLQDVIFKFFMANRQYVNNWNLVDSSAPYIVGPYLWDKDRQVLTDLAQAENVWDRRIAIVSTWFFIRNNDFDWTIKLAVLLRNDTHHLIQKAVGWMLREVGKKNPTVLVQFLNAHAAYMPRIMLRAALEKFPISERNLYLLKKFLN